MVCVLEEARGCEDELCNESGGFMARSYDEGINCLANIYVCAAAALSTKKFVDISVAGGKKDVAVV